ncbi:MAG: hypothetical protein J6D87_01620 [Clostridia bacterium]|nr:hypothetical protein [Clostridia bacterium]
MKKFLVLMMAILMCLGCLAACSGEAGDGTQTGTGTGTEAITEAGASLADAVEYLKGMYKADNGKETPNDYDMPAQIKIQDVTYTVTWTTDNAAIVVKESTKAGFYTIDLPAKNETAGKYKLTATVADPNGATETVEFERVLPVYDASAVVTRPEEGVAYKFYLVHAGLGQTLFANGETDNDKYLKTTTDPKAGLDFYVEADGDGFKFYTTIGGNKMYVKASTVTSDDGKTSKYIAYSATEGTTWTYKSETNGWYATISGAEYVVGTYGSYNTFSISDSSYLSAENSGKTQFPGGLILKEVAEAMTPSEGPTIYETPEEIVNAVYALDLGGYLSGGHTYTLTGVITEIPSPWSDDYGNISVVIVVGDMTDKPIECFRLKGEGAQNLEVGNTITVSGKLTKYNNNTETGKVEFDAGCTLVSSNACAHVEEIIAGKEATCTETGMTEGKKCTTCGDILVAQEEIPALGHDWSAVLAQDADNHWTVCTRCDEIKDKTAHTMGDNSVCTGCGYGCDHAEQNAATCTTPATCKDCGANVAPAKGHTEEIIPAVAPTCKDTGLTEGKKCSVCGEILVAQETVAKTTEHTYTDNKDATCNVCGFEREIAKMVVFYCPKDSKYITGTEYFYTGKSKMELTLSENKADAIAMQQITNDDGSVSFMADGKYLFCDAKHVEFVSSQSEYTKFVIETADGGVYIKCFSATYYDKPQYLEVYSGYLTCYSMTATVADFLLVIQDADGANGTVKDDSNSVVDQNSTPSTPSTPSTGSLDAKTPEVGKAYKFAFIQENVGTDIYYLTGAKSSYYMATSKTKADGADFYVESTNGGYYLYCMVGGAKKYVNMVVSGTHVNGEFEDTATTVYTYDTTLKTLKAVVNDADYIFGTRNDNTYTTLGPVKASNNPFYAQFIQ